jgi:hypothetical protein
LNLPGKFKFGIFELFLLVEIELKIDELETVSLFFGFAFKLFIFEPIMTLDASIDAVIDDTVDGVLVVFTLRLSSLLFEAEFLEIGVSRLGVLATEGVAFFIRSVALKVII